LTRELPKHALTTPFTSGLFEHNSSELNRSRLAEKLALSGNTPHPPAPADQARVAPTTDDDRARVANMPTT